MSYTQLYYHLIFRTKHSRPAIAIEYEKELYSYIWGCIKKRKSVLYQIGGIEDHLHLFCDIHPSFSLSEFVRDIKTASSIMLSNNPHFPLFCGWGEGYAALTYSQKEKDNVINYIKNQKQHHKNESFEIEYRRFIEEAGIDFDEKYFLKD